MVEVGLMPSNTGAVGGKMTGVHMSHYLIIGGPFSHAFAELAATGWKLNLESAAHMGRPDGRNSKVKSTCPKCRGNGWAKPNYQLACVACGNVPMIPEIASYDRKTTDASYDRQAAE